MLAIIFDLDGTVFDNEGVWEAAFRAVIDSLPAGRKIPVDTGWIHEPGIGVSPNWKKLTGQDEVEELARATRNKYWEVLGTESNLVVRSGFVELVEQAKESGWQTALATSSQWHMVEKELTELELYLAFDITTTGEEVLQAKPDPEIYILTCQKLGLEPSECVVVEDSLAGVKAGVGAGCVVVGISSEYATEEQLTRAGANLVVDNLNLVMVRLAEYGDQKTSQEKPHYSPDKN